MVKEVFPNEKDFFKPNIFLKCQQKNEKISEPVIGIVF